MKKLSKILTLLAATMAIMLLSSAAFAADIAIELDGHIIKSDVAPRAVQGRTCVPVRVVAEALGAQVLYNYGTNDGTVTITTLDGDVLAIKTGAKSGTLTKAASKEYKTITLDVPAKAYNGRVMLPLRAVAEAFGIKVDYEKGKVILSSTPAQVNGKPLNSVTVHWYMTMGGKIEGYYGNATVARIYKLLADGKLQEMAAPERFSRMYNMDVPQFTLDREYSFYTGKPDIQQKGLVNWTVYQATNPGDPNPGIYVGYALHDEDTGKWYKFSADAFDGLAKLLSSLTSEVLLNNIV